MGWVIAGAAAFAAAVLLLMVGASCLSHNPVDRDAEDREQMQYLREYARRKAMKKRMREERRNSRRYRSAGYSE